MPVSYYTRQELEEIFEGRYKNKHIQLSYPKYKTVTGKVDRVAFDHQGNLIIQMNQNRYSISLESVDECIKLL